MSAVPSSGRPEPYVGRPHPRIEDGPLLTGAAEFVADIELPETLHVAFLRSPYAHGRIVRLEVAAARGAPGVHAVYSAADLGLQPLHPPVENPDAFSPPRPLLADDVVRFVGEPVVAVVADDPYRAEDALEAIELEIDPLPAVVDPIAACGDDAPRLHEGTGNVLYDSRFEGGDVDAAFARAAVVIERAFRNPRYGAAPMEGRGVIAAPEADGLVVWASSQAPHRFAMVLAELTGLAPERVRVVCPDIGGGFGQKAHTYPEEVVTAWAALTLGRPVRWIEDRMENLLAASHARDQRVTVRVAADGDGRLLAIDADVVCDQGAYGVFPHGHILEALGTPAMLPGPYRLPAYRFRSRSVATNKGPEGAYRGVGLPVSAFVHERVMDLLAAEVGVDPAEIRRRNLVAADEMPHTTLTNQRYDSGDYHEALDRALAAIDYDGFAARQEAARRDGRLLGLGISCWVEYTGINSRVFQGRGMVGIPGVDGAHVTLTDAGRAVVWTTLPGIGQGSDTTFTQMAADALGLRPDQVEVARADTSVGNLRGTGTFASRSAISGGGALAEATGELRKRVLDAAAAHLEADPVDLRIEAGRVAVAGVPSRFIEVGDLVASAPGPDHYRVSATYDPPALAYPYATHVAEVEVDPGTGAVEIIRYVVVEDCGTVINPLIVEGQVHGATAQGIGGTLFEELVYSDDGQLVTASFMDYLLPTASDLPSFEVGHMVTPAPDTANGAKGVGEGGTLGPPGALANAVSNALGREFNSLPLRPEAVRAAAFDRLAPTTARG